MNSPIWSGLVRSNWIISYGQPHDFMIGSKTKIDVSTVITGRSLIEQKPFGITAYITNHASDPQEDYLLLTNLGVLPLRDKAPFFIERSIEQSLKAQTLIPFSSGSVLDGKITK